MTDVEQDWREDGHREYDANRWNPEESPTKCQVCGTRLDGVGDRAALAQYCEECGVKVWIA